MSEPKIVRILGTAPNLMEMPTTPVGIEVWCANNPKVYHKYRPAVDHEWTRWFNLHSRHHMETAYPQGLAQLLAQDGSKPFYTQKFWPDIPGCIEFPRQKIQEAFTDASHYFTCSITWLIAFAILEGFTHIEFYGVMLRDKPDKGHDCYKFERPCFFYWVNEAISRGIVVTYQKEVEEYGPATPGDPSTYRGPLYGYDTKPELENTCVKS